MTADDGAIRVRRARVEEAPLLGRIARAAKAYWGYPQQWLEIWHDQLTITRDYVESESVYVAEIKGQVAGFYAVEAMGEGLYSLEHLWVDPHAIRQGVGTALVRHLIAALDHQKAQRLRIESDPNAQGFYQRMGAVPDGVMVYELAGERRELPLLRIEFPSCPPNQETRKH